MSTVVEPALGLQLLAPADWPIVRAARLEALRESPHAFVSRYEKEEQLSPSDWERTFESGNWMVALQATEVIGLARTVLDPLQPEIRHMESIWVAPDRRRHGVFRAILDALCEAERRLGGNELFLWVLEDNHVAQQVYEAVGFEPTGRRQFLSEVGRHEIQQRLNIRAFNQGEVSRAAKVVRLSASQSFKLPVIQPQEVHSPSGAPHAIYAT